MNMVNEYEDEPSYANDDGYGSEDRSQGYDDKYKSKDKETGNSVSISKIKCENINNNFNNVVIKNLNIGNSGRGVALDDGTNGALSTNAYGNNGDRYNDGYQKDKGISCVINNNNTIITGADNVTEPEPLTCEDCFGANSTLQGVIEEFFVDVTGDTTISVNSDTLIIPGEINTIEQLCPLLQGHTDALIERVIEIFVETETGSVIGFEASIDALIECLLDAGVIVEANTGLAASNINTTGGVASSLSTQSTIAQGTEDSSELTAMEKITKLKTQ